MSAWRCLRNSTGGLTVCVQVLGSALHSCQLYISLSLSLHAVPRRATLIPVYIVFVCRPHHHISSLIPPFSFLFYPFHPYLLHHHFSPPTCVHSPKVTLYHVAFIFPSLHPVSEAGIGSYIVKGCLRGPALPDYRTSAHFLIIFFSSSMKLTDDLVFIQL